MIPKKRKAFTLQTHIKTILPALLGSCFAILIMGASLPSARSAPTQDVRWYDGSKAPAPSGALLTNNTGYWGTMVPTNVTYSYAEPPTTPADVLGNDKTQFGNRLLDGRNRGDWHSTVGIVHQPLVVDFDFHQTVTIGEIAVTDRQSQDLSLAEVEVKTGADEQWRKVLTRTASKGTVHHLVLPQPAAARYVRLTLKSDSATTYLSQVWMWGDAKPMATQAGINGFLPEMKESLAKRGALPGDATILTPAALAQWRQSTGFTDNDLVWQTAPVWQMLQNDSLKDAFLPGKEALRQPVQITATRQEGESAALFLVNAADTAQDVTVQLEPFKDQSGQSTPALEVETFAAGAIWTRRWGHTFRPLFSAENKLGGALMEKYLTNGGVIKDFPTLHLPARGTALIWLTVNTQNAAPGKYTTFLNAGTQRIPVQLEVLPITLPRPDVWVRFWGNHAMATRNLWRSEAAVQREVKYQQSLGVSVWDGFPTEESYALTARQQGQRSYYVIGLSNSIRDAGYGRKLDPDNLGAALEKKVRDEVLQMVQSARAAGLSYDDWSVELWDEPGPANMKSWVAVARLVKAADPKVQVYMNPLFWTQGVGFANDERQVQALEGWYNQLVDISVPIRGQTIDQNFPQANQQFYGFQPRRVRAYFTHPNPGRMLTWDAFVRGYNGWGSYAYLAPSGDAWNDFDGSSFDYQIVYPGPNGYIPTIESESMRESWEDYRLLTLLKQQGKTAELTEILNTYQDRVLIIPGGKLPFLREKMMQAVTK